MALPAVSTTSTLNNLNCSSSSFTTNPPSSSPPSSFSTFDNPSSHFDGLDLLVMAVMKVEGNGFWIEMDGEEKEDGKKRKSTEKEKKNGEVKQEKVTGEELGLEKKRERRHMKVPAKFQNSVLLQPWKRQNGRRQR